MRPWGARIPPSENAWTHRGQVEAATRAAEAVQLPAWRKPAEGLLNAQQVCAALLQLSGEQQELVDCFEHFGGGRAEMDAAQWLAFVEAEQLTPEMGREQRREEMPAAEGHRFEVMMER